MKIMKTKFGGIFMPSFSHFWGIHFSSPLPSVGAWSWILPHHQQQTTQKQTALAVH
jgi:hypothetical protein